MELLKNKYFISCVLLFTVFHLWQDFFSTTPFLSNYLDDLLCLPIVLSGVLAVQRYFSAHSQRFVLPTSHIVFSFVFIAVIFEGILPAISAKYTQDFYDIFAYATGGFFFSVFINQAGD
ncbi:MAG: hypothetical protein DWQ10_16510 [Calditrichaeota bacterium]|nr:MAG: hypothetical protein DWQ10_16510 [Calditrichota bacterium]